MPLHHLSLLDTQEAIIAAHEVMRHSEIGKLYDYLGCAGGEWNYVLGVLLNGINTIKTFPLSALRGITLGWNYLDAVYAMIAGVLQWSDQDSHERLANKIKGTLNIFSGIQLFAFSYNPPLCIALGLGSSIALAGSSFAVAMLIDAIVAAIDCYRAYQLTTFSGWQAAKQQELDHKKIQCKKLEDKLNLLTSNIDQDEEKNLQTEDSDQIKYLKAKTTLLNKQIKDIDAEWQLTENEYQNDCQQKLATHYHQHVINLVFKTTSFIGMALLAVTSFVTCPPLFITGLALVSIVAAYYLYKNGSHLYQKSLPTCKAGFNKLNLFSRGSRDDNRQSGDTLTQDVYHVTSRAA